MEFFSSWDRLLSAILLLFLLNCVLICLLYIVMSLAATKTRKLISLLIIFIQIKIFKLPNRRLLMDFFNPLILTQVKIWPCVYLINRLLLLFLRVHWVIIHRLYPWNLTLLRHSHWIFFFNHRSNLLINPPLLTQPQKLITGWVILQRPKPYCGINRHSLLRNIPRPLKLGINQLLLLPHSFCLSHLLKHLSPILPIPLRK